MRASIDSVILAEGLSPRAADLVARFTRTLESAEGASRAGLMETLRKDCLDWQLDNGLITEIPRTLLSVLSRGKPPSLLIRP